MMFSTKLEKRSVLSQIRLCLLLLSDYRTYLYMHDLNTNTGHTKATKPPTVELVVATKHWQPTSKCKLDYNWPKITCLSQ